MQSRSHRLIKERTGAELIMFPSESAKTVQKMKFLVPFLFLGATVALAAIVNDPYHKHNHHPMLKECMEKCGMKPTMPGELADEENDPHGHHHHHPSWSPEEKKCVHECLEEYKPSNPGKVADEEEEEEEKTKEGCIVPQTKLSD